jgi:hypothetical protein
MDLLNVGKFEENSARPVLLVSKELKFQPAKERTKSKQVETLEFYLPKSIHVNFFS